MYAGDVVFAVSGALCAARHRMDVLGFVLIGTITGIGGGITSYGGGFDSISLTNSIVAGNIISGTATPDDLALINSTNSFTSGGPMRMSIHSSSTDATCAGTAA